MSLLITLTDHQLSLASAIAANRNNPKEQHGVHSKKIDASKSELDAHLMGVKAEIAVASYYGSCVSYFAQLTGDDGVDVKVNGFDVEIKCRGRVGYDFALLSDDPYDFTADIGILVYRISDDVFRIQGTISRYMFIRTYKVRDYGYGSRAYVSADQLSDPELLRMTHKRVTWPRS